MHNQQLTQICLHAEPRDLETDFTRCLRDEAKFHEKLISLCPKHLWYHESYSTGSPRPILVGAHHQNQAQDLHEALTIAVTDIVQRWWNDDAARFPERMPLLPAEEDLLKWIEDQVLLGNLPPYDQCRGSWRPDFMVEEVDGRQGENFRITEINARFSFNGFMYGAYGQDVVNNSVGGESVLVGATDPNKILDGLFSLFLPDRPLHLLKGEEPGVDIHMFVHAVWRRFGTKPRLITPADLRIVPDYGSKNGTRLCCVVKDQGVPITSSTFESADGEVLEEIYQVGLELHQRELAALEPEMLRALSLRCFNDMRTILLVHDKRMLGIVKQEMPRMVARGVLTPEQAYALDRGVADSILPGSEELDCLIRATVASPKLRHSYILKAIRSGKGDGIIFGEDVGADEWVCALQRLVSPRVVPGITCVVQRRIIPCEYDLVLTGSEGRARYPLVGTFLMVNGKLLGLGAWRSSGGRVVAVSSGGSWICSVMRRG